MSTNGSQLLSETSRIIEVMNAIRKALRDSGAGPYETIAALELVRNDISSLILSAINDGRDVD